jgi:BirA family biotin operon repressor/biotin-[acetyl-CoA-carboxylase] ligase
MEILGIEETSSTNSWVTANRDRLQAPVLVYALRQTAGRGQRGNSWEAEPGRNITCSILLTPTHIRPAEQFAISEAVALGVVDMLASYGVEAKVKWPNDIYVADRKICGILIEHSLMPDHIMHTVAGIGVNINQERFLSDAPNPVSLLQLTGVEHDLTEAVATLARMVETRMATTLTEEGRAALHSEFMARMWRADGVPHPFHDNLTGEDIEATITAVAPDGLLTLTLADATNRQYAFKQIEFK